MPFTKTRPDLKLSHDNRAALEEISKTRSNKAYHVDRAKMILLYSDGESISSIARILSTNRPKIERCIDKALEMGALAALDDLSGRGKPPIISDDAKAWLINLACQKPIDFGYSYELWTHALLAKHARKNYNKAGFPSLKKIAKGTISKILSKAEIKPHKIRYYLERRDKNFEEKMSQVLCVYKEIQIIRDQKSYSGNIEYVSYDEKPGIQAISNTAPDLLPESGKYQCISRDHEYVRHGTISLLAGIDLLSGYVHGMIAKRHRSREFIQFLDKIDGYYPEKNKIRIILDNHSAHISKETRSYLKTKPNRFEFIFTPTHGSWLNLVEIFFSKMSRTMLRGIRVDSVKELESRIKKYLREINRDPVVFKWKYGLDEIKINKTH